MAAVVGFAFLVTVVTPVGKQVFLFVVTTIPNAMRCMATTAAMVKKSSRWPFKKSAVGDKKTTAYSAALKSAYSRGSIYCTLDKK